MSFGSLTTGDNIVLVNNATLTSGAVTAGFSVNYASGYFTLTTAASSGIGNVEITTHKPVLSSTCITNCTFSETYGEGNDTNVYLSGNSSFPARIFWCDAVQGATYFPATSYADVGVQNDKMMGFLKTANTLQLWKYRSVHGLIGTPPNNAITEMYDGEGLIATDTLKLVDGVPTGLSQRGVVQLKPEMEGYKLELISEDVNGTPGVRAGIITESDASKQSAFAIVHDRKYWLHLNDKIYFYQYNLKHQGAEGRTIYPWLRWKLYNNSTCFVAKDGDLYFGGAGNFYKFDPNSLNDDSNPISAYWYSKKSNVRSSYDMIKRFVNYFLEFRTVYGYTSVTVDTYINDYHIASSLAELDIPAFWSPEFFNPNSFNPFNGSITPNIVKRFPVNIKGQYFQYKISCSDLNNAFALISGRLFYVNDRRMI